MRLLALCGIVLLASAVADAQVTPLEQALVEENETTITCEFKTDDKAYGPVPAYIGEAGFKPEPGTYHYKLWVPKGYLAQPARRWPCMFIASPSGKASMGRMAERLKRGGYVVVSLVESSNESHTNLGNFFAAHDDVVKRMRIQEGLKFGTGMSGGARVSGIHAQTRPGFSGLVCQAAGLAPYRDGPNQGKYVARDVARVPGFTIAMTLGRKDSMNAAEGTRMAKDMPGSVRFKLFEFDGGHDWAPTEVFNEAIDWLERQIYVEGPLRADMKAAYAIHFSERYSQWESVTSPWPKYQRGAALLDFARARQLSTDTFIAPKLRSLQAETNRLRSDPQISKEAMADDAWKRLQASHRGTVAAKIAADCRDFAKRYPGTEAGREAEAKAAQ